LPDVGPKTVKTKRAGKPSADAALRKRIELAVERLLRALDTLDTPTEELEPDGDEGDDQVKTTNPMPTARSPTWTANRNLDQVINQERSWHYRGRWHAGQLRGIYLGADPELSGAPRRQYDRALAACTDELRTSPDLPPGRFFREARLP
jgi:hypothetical protein